jgi:hypothetical protein
VRNIIRLLLAASLLVGTCSVSLADGGDPPPCVPGSPGCSNPKVLQAPATRLAELPVLVQMR